MTDIFEIRHEREHYEVYVNGAFYCSADTSVEAAHEIETYIEEQEQVAQLDWDHAVENVRRVLYEKYSPTYSKTCNTLLTRYNNGDRSRDLYERMIVIQ